MKQSTQVLCGNWYILFDTAYSIQMPWDPRVTNSQTTHLQYEGAYLYVLYSTSGILHELCNSALH